MDTMTLSWLIWGALAAEPATLPEALAATRDALEAQEQRSEPAAARSRSASAALALAPSVSATAGYTRNQYAVVVELPNGTDTPDEAVITPIDQLDLRIEASLPDARRSVGQRQDDAALDPRLRAAAELRCRLAL